MYTRSDVTFVTFARTLRTLTFVRPLSSCRSEAVMLSPANRSGQATVQLRGC
jgi:hypothetical protein